MRGKYYDFNPNLLGLMHLLSVIAIARGGSKNARFNELFIIPIALLSIHLLFFSASDNLSSDYVLATSVTTIFFTASDFVLLRRFQPELRMIGQKKPNTAEMTFLERPKWALQLELTPRGINWAHEPTDHISPRPTTKSRTRFIVSQLLSAMYYFISFDIVSILIRANPCFALGGPSFSEFGWAWRATIWLYPFLRLVYAWMSMLYCLVSVVAVALHLWEPRDWPHPFGSLRDAYTLRKCWGRVWHQMLRKFLTTHMNFFCASSASTKRDLHDLFQAVR